MIRAAIGFGPGLIDLFDENGWGDECLGCTGFDGDDDGRCTGEPDFDCDDGRPESWATPGEARGLRFSDRDNLSWRAPAQPGGAAVTFDTLRSEEPGDFQTAAVCLSPADPGATSIFDDTIPGAGVLLNYLVRATNSCPMGEGSLGTGAAGAERSGTACP